MSAKAVKRGGMEGVVWMRRVVDKVMGLHEMQ